MGWSRGPSPLAFDHRISPFFRSMATSRPYGGLKMGSSLGPSSGASVSTTSRMSERGCSDGTMPMIDSLWTDGT